MMFKELDHSLNKKVEEYIDKISSLGTILTPDIARRVFMLSARPSSPSKRGHMFNIIPFKISTTYSAVYEVYNFVRDSGYELVDEEYSRILNEWKSLYIDTEDDLIFSDEGEDSAFVHVKYIPHKKTVRRNGFLEPNIGDYTSPETFDKFKDLYSFAKL